MEKSESTSDTKGMAHLRLWLYFTFLLLGFVILNGLLWTWMEPHNVEQVPEIAVHHHESMKLKMEQISNLYNYACLSVKVHLQRVVLAHLFIALILLFLLALFVAAVNILYIVNQSLGHVYVYIKVMANLRLWLWFTFLVLGFLILDGLLWTWTELHNVEQVAEITVHHHESIKLEME